MRRLRRFIWAAVLVIPVVTAVAWAYSRTLASGVLAVLATSATVVMAVTVYQLDLSLQHLGFDALNKTYEFLNRDIKGQLDEILDWAEKKKPVEEVLNDDRNREVVRYASVALNKIGYFVYKGILEVSFVQEEFGGLVVKSFVSMRPYLVAMRGQSEPDGEPWFMRRFFLLIAIACERYLAEKFPTYLGEIVGRYADADTKRDFASGSMVPRDWLAEEIRSWLEKRQYLVKS